MSVRGAVVQTKQPELSTVVMMGVVQGDSNASAGLSLSAGVSDGDNPTAGGSCVAMNSRNATSI
eukprot:CAMPEP_0175943228 /NCGR_PEP_ID=MMETSP0108-20121206/25426_1 /TAXON_ID=195067 ORGANISM="Goniomonas pacifica, Strain CCMP1869" /NCGR_SAMPLE_ID=MMETSP0108 /ASSEMBLY_ACC=CAM_ASM_000204 /LENGTH=63 /DNA_ID=CAMNT_0017268149 /DNA_START=19 /DNA_END=211 /DNA_ORIENTATION=-